LRIFSSAAANAASTSRTRASTSAWNIQGTFREHLGNIQGTFREHSGSVQGMFREHLVRAGVDAREPPSQLQEALQENTRVDAEYNLPK
jgi:hypothetical protein